MKTSKKKTSKAKARNKRVAAQQINASGQATEPHNQSLRPEWRAKAARRTSGIPSLEHEARVSRQGELEK